MIAKTLAARFAAALLAASLAAAPAAAQEPAEGIGGSFMLRDHMGRVVRDQEFLGRFMLLFFGYTFCPDVCPTGLHTIGQALDLLGEDAAQVQALFVSVDPARDTPKVLAEYVRAFHPAILGLTGPQEFVDSVVGKYKVKVVKVPDASGGYTVDHTASAFLVGRDGKYVKRYPHGMSPEDMAADLRQMIRAQ